MSAKEPILLLWDIDGTIITSGNAGEEALRLSLKRLHNLDLELERIDYRGRTDVKISYMILKEYGIEASKENVDAFLQGYFRGLEEELPKRHASVLPGVLDILNDPSGRFVHGLLTGNCRRGAQLKLTEYGVWHYFPFGAFADDSMERNDLGPFALRRAQEQTGKAFPPSRVFIIGDTPHDISCGKIIGAHTVGVSTGTYTFPELSACQPSALFENLSDVNRFISHVEQLAA